MKAKRVFASLLAATLIFSAVPTTVFAAEAAKEEGWAADYSVYYYEENGEWKEFLRLVRNPKRSTIT